MKEHKVFANLTESIQNNKELNRSLIELYNSYCKTNDMPLVIDPLLKIYEIMMKTKRTTEYLVLTEKLRDQYLLRKPVITATAADEINL